MSETPRGQTPGQIQPKHSPKVGLLIRCCLPAPLGVCTPLCPWVRALRVPSTPRLYSWLKPLGDTTLIQTKPEPSPNKAPGSLLTPLSPLKAPLSAVGGHHKPPKQARRHSPGYLQHQHARFTPTIASPVRQLGFLHSALALV